MAKRRSKSSTSAKLEKSNQAAANPKRRHESFRRTYREDYLKTDSAPGVTEHAAKAFAILFKNFKLFLPFAAITVLCGVATIGTNGLVGAASSSVFAIIIGVMILMVTIFALRQIIAGNKITLRDAMYNAFTSLVPTVIMLAVIAVECLPIALLVIAASAAVETNFLAMPFYAMLFFVFALLMILLSGYLLAASIMALVAVTAPGLYPLTALLATSELMRGQRVRLLARVIVLMIIIGIIGALIIIPLRALGLTGVALSIVEMSLACLGGIYATTYLYLYYQWIIK